MPFRFSKVLPVFKPSGCPPDVRTVVAYWLVAGPVLLLDYSPGVSWAQAAGKLAFTVALDTVAALVLVKSLLPAVQSRRQWALVVAGLLGFVVLSGSCYLVGYSWLVGDKVRWSVPQVGLAAIAHAKSYGLLAVLLAGQRYLAMQQQVLRTQQAQAQAELRLLKAQIDPHFLFNNLNLLHTLIEEDRQAASHYLQCFAALYRYLIRHQHDDFVALAEELRFADDYRYLVQQRFGAAYRFEQLATLPAGGEGLFVVPGTVQLLLENAIKHNQGDADHPLVITLRVAEDTLSVHNERRPKLTPVDSTGVGLRNLCERYSLLASRPVLVQAGPCFEVTVPVLRLAAGPAQPAPAP
ncbi:MAG: sensor histidine kinase [Janthinobacterium lividum]